MYEKIQFKHARTCVYNVNYHIVWSVNYRYSVLNQEIEVYLKGLFQEIAQEKGFEVIMMEVGEQDHIHVFASAHPKVAPSYTRYNVKRNFGTKIVCYIPSIEKEIMRRASLE